MKFQCHNIKLCLKRHSQENIVSVCMYSRLCACMSVYANVRYDILLPKCLSILGALSPSKLSVPFYERSIAAQSWRGSLKNSGKKNIIFVWTFCIFLFDQFLFPVRRKLLSNMVTSQVLVLSCKGNLSSVICVTFTKINVQGESG